MESRKLEVKELLEKIGARNDQEHIEIQKVILHLDQAEPEQF